MTDWDLDDRDVRALTECMTILYDGGSMFEVVSESGRTHTVDTRTGRCTCRDYEHNLPDGDRVMCKHRARIAFATGERPIPGWVDMDQVDNLLGEQLPNAEPRVAVADGGRLFRETNRKYVTEAVDGGTLVWEDTDGAGRDLVGVTAVEDWTALRMAMIRKGLDAGAIHELEQFDPAEVGL